MPDQLSKALLAAAAAGRGWERCPACEGEGTRPGLDVSMTCEKNWYKTVGCERGEVRLFATRCEICAGFGSVPDAIEAKAAAALQALGWMPETGDRVRRAAVSATLVCIEGEVAVVLSDENPFELETWAVEDLAPGEPKEGR